jgi:membrane-associated phospholipid phosphatase
MSAANVITDLGDGAVTGAIALVLALWLLFSNEKRAALAVLAASGMAGLVIALGKLFLYSAGPLAGFASPSGHAAVSTAVYGILALVAGPSVAGGRARVPIYLLAAFLVGGIAASRFVLGAHTLLDVAAGTTVGLAACIAADRLILRGTRVRVRWLPLCAALALVAVLLHGVRLPAEDMIRKAGETIRGELEDR